MEPAFAMRRRKPTYTEAETLNMLEWSQWAIQRTRGRCMGCGKWWLGFEIHHIERKSHASGRGSVECNLLLLCRKCHAEEFSTMKHAQQLAYKLYWDEPHFDLLEWLQIRDQSLRAPRRVTMADIRVYSPELQERFRDIIQEILK